MNYTEQKEREHRFALALRMGLPIFFLSSVTLFALLTQRYTTFSSLVILSVALLGVMIYFIFYLIYQSIHENITDTITHVDGITPVIQGFLQRTHQGTFSIADLNDEILDWCRVNERGRSFRIQV